MTRSPCTSAPSLLLNLRLSTAPSLSSARNASLCPVSLRSCPPSSAYTSANAASSDLSSAVWPPAVGQRRHHEGPGGRRARDGTAAEFYPRGIGRVVVFDDDVDGRRIRAEGIGHHRAVELVGERGAAARLRPAPRPTVLHVGVELGLHALQIGDQRAIRAPGELLGIRHEGPRHRMRNRAGPRIDDIDVRTSILVRSGFMRADEGDPAAVGRPRGQSSLNCGVGGQRIGTARPRHRIDRDAAHARCPHSPRHPA